MCLCRVKLIKIILSKGEPVVSLRRQINHNGDQNAADIDKISDPIRLATCELMFSYFCSIII